MFRGTDMCQWRVPWYLSFNYLANIFHEILFSEECTSSLIGGSKCLCGINTCKPGETCENGHCHGKEEDKKDGVL